VKPGKQAGIFMISVVTFRRSMDGSVSTHETKDEHGKIDAR
jgi:hypothetical protein